MKFNVEVGNPPYNRGILGDFDSTIARGNASIAFFEKCSTLLANGGSCSLVLPTNFLTLPSMKPAREWMLTNLQIISIQILSNKNKELFDITNQLVLVLTFSVGDTIDNSAVKFTSHTVFGAASTFIVDLTKYNFWPLYLDEMSVSILDKAISHKIKSLKSAGTYFVFFPVVGDTVSHYHTKHWLVNKIRSTVKCPLFIYFDSEQESLDYFNFTQTKYFNYLLNLVKATPKNQVKVIDYLGVLDYSAFLNSLTPDEINHINTFI